MLNKFGMCLAVCLLGTPLFAAEQDRMSDAVWAHVNVSSVTTSTVTIAIDLSNTTTWPHRSARSIQILGWKMDVDKVAAGTGTVKIGVLTSVNASSGTVSWFQTKNFIRNASNTTNLETMNLFPAAINTYVSASGTTPYLITSETTTLNDTEALEYQNDVPLPATVGAGVVPSVGDILLRVIGGGANAVGVVLDILYFGLP